MKRKNLILAVAVSSLALGLGSCVGFGWSVASDPYCGPDVGIYVDGGSYYNPGPPPPRPLPPRPTPWGGPGWPGPW
ncbi:MAG: hypothetical protein K2L91_10410 [Duncaniella sp.]|nr:hypothetical protein [Duncaniella sp.]MDE6328927.1 hypothetical protein [Duncaniella sp.]MDE6465465.1 hypothetical protein [Duncaniella sp.]MDE6573529.1 hypothetical protein [Duncaniella sp.]